MKKIESDRRKREKIASIGKAFKPAKKVANKLIMKPGGNLFSKIMEFFSIMISGVLIKALPELLDGIKKFFNNLKPFLNTMQNVLGGVSESVGNFLEVFKKKPAFSHSFLKAS